MVTVLILGRIPGGQVRTVQTSCHHEFAFKCIISPFAAADPAAGNTWQATGSVRNETSRHGKCRGECYNTFIIQLPPAGGR